MEREQQHRLPLHRAVALASHRATTVALSEPAHCAPEVRAPEGRRQHHDQGDGDLLRRPGASLWNEVISFEALYAAYRRARRAKRSRPESLRFSAHLDHEILRLQAELLNGTYRPGPFRRFMIHDPKPREIAAPAFRDRVVHHSLCAAIGPLCERRFIYDSYACREGKGTHAAATRLQVFIRAATEHGDVWALKADVAGYFASISHDLLEAQLHRIVTDPQIRWLINRILASEAEGADLPRRGLPIGALTSQLFANVYLDPLDHFAKEGLHTRWYIRYMDDFVMLSRDKQQVRDWCDATAQFLSQCGLRLNPKTAILRAAHGIPFVGYRIWPCYRRIRQSTLRRIRRRLRDLQGQYASQQVDATALAKSLQSWAAHLAHADTGRLRTALWGNLTFKRRSHAV